MSRPRTTVFTARVTVSRALATAERCPQPDLNRVGLKVAVPGLPGIRTSFTSSTDRASASARQALSYRVRGLAEPDMGGRSCCIVDRRLRGMRGNGGYRHPL